MVDAAFLARQTPDGGILWHPSGLEDRDRLPLRVLDLFNEIMRGLGTPAWVWLRPAGTTSHGHQYRPTFTGYPATGTAPRCGRIEPLDTEEWEGAGEWPCPACSRIERGEGEDFN